MPNLVQSLYSHDLGHLRILAEHWGIALTAPDVRAARNELAAALLHAELAAEIVLALSVESQAALQALLKNNGRLPWLQFTRSYGQLRAVGPGRRDRERPDRTPISPAEELWYRGFIARAFFETPAGAQEFAYLPADLCLLIPAAPKIDAQSGIPAGSPCLGRAATPEERAHPRLVNDRLLDHICTLLASHRLQIDPTSQFPDTDFQQPAIPLVPVSPLLDFAATLLKTANLLVATGAPDISNARAHLETLRGAALAQVTQAWLHSPTHNDLHLVPHLQPEGDWQNDPLGARVFLLRLLKAIPADTWWSVSAFLADLRRDFPDFQRPAGDYDSWFIRDTRTDMFLSGFENWDAVDGALVRYLITGPLYWLGILDLAVLDEDTAPEKATAFRRSKWAEALLGSAAPPNFQAEDAPLHVRSDGRVGIPFLAPRVARYQIARFCQWEKPTAHEYRYRFTPGSLDQAIEQGLKIQHLQTLLARHAQHVPPNIVKALSRWDQRGTEARLQSAVILRLGSPDLLKALRNSRAARYLGDPLGPTTVIVKPGAGEKVLEVLTEMGHLGEVLDQA